MWIYSWNNEIMKTKDSSYFTKFFLDTMKNHILNRYKFDGNPERPIFWFAPNEKNEIEYLFDFFIWPWFNSKVSRMVTKATIVVSHRYNSVLVVVAFQKKIYVPSSLTWYNLFLDKHSL